MDLRLAAAIEIRQYTMENGRAPFRDWRRALKNPVTRQRADARLSRIRGGNLGDHKDLGGGVYELRPDFGPGYRIYFARERLAVIALLVGGDKGSQTRDVATARRYLHDVHA